MSNPDDLESSDEWLIGFHYGEDPMEVAKKDDPFEILAAIEEEAEVPLVYLIFQSE